MCNADPPTQSHLQWNRKLCHNGSKNIFIPCLSYTAKSYVLSIVIVHWKSLNVFCNYDIILPFRELCVPTLNPLLPLGFSLGLLRQSLASLPIPCLYFLMIIYHSHFSSEYSVWYKKIYITIEAQANSECVCIIEPLSMQ